MSNKPYQPQGLSSFLSPQGFSNDEIRSLSLPVIFRLLTLLVLAPLKWSYSEVGYWSCRFFTCVITAQNNGHVSLCADVRPRQDSSEGTFSVGVFDDNLNFIHSTHATDMSPTDDTTPVLKFLLGHYHSFGTY